MTESAGNKKEDCHAANGVKPGRNGMVKNHHHHHQYQKQEKVRPHHALRASNHACLIFHIYKCILLLMMMHGNTTALLPG